MTITLRSSKELQGRKEVEKNQTNVEAESRNKKSTCSEKELQSKNGLSYENQKPRDQKEAATKKKVQKEEEVRSYQPPNSQYVKFLNMFKKLEINIHFAEALAQIPHYEKFMKDIIIKNRKLDGGGVASLSASCSAIIKKNLPHKMQDLSSFTIPCTIRNHEFGKALCDSSASINLMTLLAV